MKFLRNQWYCAGIAIDLKDKPMGLQILNERVVIYRLPDGSVSALQDRCPHRFAPLSKGTIVGENIQCPYHGLEFASNGMCAKNPWGDNVIPKAAKVKSYPVVERDLLIWIWMGDPALARVEDVLDLTKFFNVAEFPAVWGGYRLQAHYEVIVDNLMDLSHVLFLHRSTLSNGASEAATFSADVNQKGDTVIALHRRNNVVPSPLFSKAWGGRTERANHRSDMYWHPASNLTQDVGVTEIGHSQGSNDGVFMHVAHLLTPISEKETYYYWIAARNFAVDSEEMSQALKKSIDYAFAQEDEPMMGDIQDRMATPDLMSLKPITLPGDVAGIRARRITEQLRARETTSA